MNLRAPLAFGLCLSLLSAGAHAAEKRVDRTFDVKPGGVLVVDADGSNITVRGTDANQVAVHILAIGSQDTIDRMTLSAEASEDGVSVIAKQRRDSWMSWLWSSGVRDSKVTVSVPKRYRVKLKTSGGDIDVAQLQGNVDGSTSGGDVRVADVTGDVRMHTSGGDIRAEKIHGETELQTSGGKVRALEIDGRVRVASSGGNVEAEIVGANRGIDASTSGGNVVLRVPRNITGNLNAHTSGGSVTSDLPVATTVNSGDSGTKRLQGSINGGGEEIKARTSGGNIQVRARD